MLKRRRRFKQVESLDTRLLAEADRLRESAKLLGPGPVREAAIKKARQMEAAAKMNAWLSVSNEELLR